MDAYADLDATALAEHVRKGDVTPSELVETAIAAIEAHDPTLNAVIHRLYDRARAQANGNLPDGPFRGVPFLVKDLDGFTADVPYQMGCRFLRDFVPDHDSEVIARLKRSGLVIVGKTNCPELGILAATEPALHGPTRNPWNTDYLPAGSSGGAAAAVAARFVPMAHGGDGGGSIRLPASACGLFGMKTSRGVVPVGPTLGEGWGGYVQPGVLTRSVRDSAAIIDAIGGPDAGDPYFPPPKARPFVDEVGVAPGTLRVAFTKDSLYTGYTHPDCVRAVEDAARLCEELGHEVVEAKPDVPWADMRWAYLIQVAAGVNAEIRDFERWTGKIARPSGFEPGTWFLKQVGESLNAGDLQWSRDTCHAGGRILGRFFREHDVFLSSTMAYPPVKVGEIAPKASDLLGLSVLRAVPVRSLMIKILHGLAERNLERTPNTQLFNQTGSPAMSVPLHWNGAGLPIGVQFAAALGGEPVLYRLAAQLEEARPWIHKKPRVCA